MGLLDSILGRTKVKQPARDRLFAMSTAYITLETSMALKHRNAAGIVFQPLATADFASIVKDTDELLRSAAEDTGTKVESSEDAYGYHWVILRDQDFEDLVVSLNVVSSNLEGGGYGDRLLCAVFAFEDERQAAVLHLQLQARRVLPVRPDRRQVPGRRARAAAQGSDRRGTAHGAGTRPLVPAVGDPPLSRALHPPGGPV